MPAGTRTFRIFVSSTFGDLAAERAVLHEGVFPSLRALCEAHGCRFQAIDLRWGVSQEAALDQRTMEICLREIARCQEVTPRPNFIILLGDRYGWRPLPAEIRADEFARLTAALTRHLRARTLLERWYRRDDNALPPVYVLQPRRVEGGDDPDPAKREAAARSEEQDWARTEGRLRTILQTAAARAGFPDQHPFRRFPSATEQEIEHGALTVEEADERVFCFFRNLRGPAPEALPADAVRRFRDTDVLGRIDADAQSRQQALKARLRARLPQVVEVEARLAEDGVTLDHLPLLASGCREALEARIRHELERLQAEPPLVAERNVHDAHRRKLAADFVAAPRAAELDALNQYLEARAGTLCAVTGAPGSGKSALIAAAVQRFADRSGDATMVVRFLGETPRSSDPRALLADLCEEIGAVYGADGALPQEFRLLGRELEQRMQRAASVRPLVIVLDALDQLSAVESAHHLAWLPAQLPPNVAVVVSSLPGECHDALERKRPLPLFVPVSDLSPGDGGEAAAIFDGMVAAAQRQVTPDQRSAVLDAAARCPRPLFLRLVSAEAVRWKSYTPTPRLATAVDGLIRDYLDALALEVNHGPMLVARSLGYLAAAKRGLTEDELLDLLSADREVLADFERRSRYGHAIAGQRLPVVVWSRLSFDLQPYLTERRADDTHLIGFYRDELRRIARDRFLDSTDAAGRPQKATLHGRLAGYFHRQAELRPTADQLVNVRRASELPFHQIHCGDWAALTATLGDVRFLHLKALAGLVFDTIDDFELADAALAAPGADTACAALLAEIGRAYNQEFRTFLDRPLAAQQIFNNLFAQDGYSGAAGASIARITEDTPVGIAGWLRRVNAAPATSTSRHLLRTLAAHEGPVSALAIAPSGAYFATGGADGMLRVWRERDGGMVAAMHAHDTTVAGLAWMAGDATETLLASAGSSGEIRVWDWRLERERRHFPARHVVQALALEPRTRWLVTGGDDRTIRLLDPERGEERILRGHQDRVVSVATSAGRLAILSGSEDRTLRVWQAGESEAAMTLRGAEAAVRAVSMASDGTWAASGGDDRVVRFWSLDGSGAQRPAAAAYRGAIADVAVLEPAAGEPLVAAGGNGEGIQLLDARTGSEKALLHGHTGTVAVVRAHRGESWFASGGEDGTVRIWNGGAAMPRHVAAVEHTGRVTSLSVIDEQRLATTSDDHTVKVWRTADGALLGTLRGHLAPVSQAAALPGSRIASASADRTVGVWDIDRWQPLARFGNPIDLSGIDPGAVPAAFAGNVGHAQAVTALVSLDGERLASGARDGSVRVWDLASGRPALELRTRGVIDHLLWSAHERLLAACGTAREVVVWSLDHPERPRLLAGHTARIGSAAVAGDAGLVVTGGYDGEVRFWTLADGVSELGIRHEGWVLAVDADATGRVRASGGKDGTIAIWRSGSDEGPRRLPAHRGPVRGVRIDPSAERVASFGEDGWIHLWDVTSGRQTASAHFDSPLTCLAWASPRGLAFGTRWGGLSLLRLEGDC